MFCLHFASDYLYTVRMKEVSLNKMLVHMLHNRKNGIFSHQRILRALRLTLDDLQPNTMCLLKNVAIEMSYSPLSHKNIHVTLTRNTVVVDITFKNMKFKNLTKSFLVLTMFIQRADNLAKLIGTTIILTFASWVHKVQ